MLIEIEDKSKKDIVEQIRRITELYLVVKETIIFFEETSPEQKSDIQPINELRNAFDHFMRVTATWTGIKKHNENDKFTPTEYIQLHLEKCFGHVYRAGYDTADYLALTIKDQITDNLEEYTPEDIKSAIPQYYSIIKPAILEVNNSITDFRTKKDVANLDPSHLISYIAEIKTLVTHYKTIIKATPSLSEIKEKRTREKKQNELYDWAKQIIIGIIFLVSGILIGAKRNDSSPNSSPNKQATPARETTQSKR